MIDFIRAVFNSTACLFVIVPVISILGGIGIMFLLGLGSEWEMRLGNKRRKTMIDFKDGVWYFAHPYTYLNNDGSHNLAGEEANFRLCCYRTAKLIDDGYLVYSPIAHTHPVHLAYPPFVGKNVYAIWYEFDKKMIELLPFAGIILAPLWKDSYGCKIELDMFKKAKKNILHYEDIT